MSKMSSSNNLIYFMFATLTMLFVSGEKVPIKIPVKRRGLLKLDGSLFIPGNNGQLIEYDVIFSITSSDFWVFGSNLKGGFLDSSEFTHQFYEIKGGSFKKNGAGMRFESMTYDGNGNTVPLVSGSIGLQGFETITFQNDNRGKYFKRTPIGIVDNVMAVSVSSQSSSNEGGVNFDYDGTFGLLPQNSHWMWPFNTRSSYLDQLPKKMFSLYLSGSGESGELMLGGYNKSKINGDIGCQQISRLQGGSGGKSLLLFTTRVYLGKQQLAADKKRRRPITTAVIDPEIAGLQAPLTTVRNIVQKSGAKFMTVLPTINEEEEQHINEEDEGYFIPCRRRSEVSHLSFFLGEKLWSITGDDLFIPSPVNPSWCKMMVVMTTGEEPLIALGDILFKKFVTIFDFEGPGDQLQLCIGTAKHRRGKRDRMKKKALLLSGSTTNTTTTMTVF